MPIPIFDKLQSAFGGPIIDSNLVDSPNLPNTIFVSSGGDNNNDGRTLNDPVQTFARALTLAASFSGTKLIICLDAGSYAENLTITISDLIVYAPNATVQAVTSTSFPSVLRLYECDALTLGLNSRVEIDQVDSVTVASGEHRITELDIVEVLPGGTINFQAATGTIYVNIRDVDDQTPTVPSGLTLRGFIGTSTYGSLQGAITATDVSVDDTSLIGLLNGVANVQSSLERIDATGLGAPITFFSGLGYTATAANDNQWFNREVRFNGTSNALRTFVLPNQSQITSAIASFPNVRGYPFRITVSNDAGDSEVVGTNRVRITANASGPVIAGRGSVTLTLGESATFEFGAAGGTWSVINEGLFTSASGAALNDIELQLGVAWDVTDLTNLPQTVQTGYAFKVTGAADDGTVVFTRRVYNNDWVVWEGASFTQWSDTSQWFVLAGTDVRRIKSLETNFFSEVTETGLRFDLSQNIFVNPANVIIQENSATGAGLNTPIPFHIDTQGQNQSIVLSPGSIQFSTLTGGKLTLDVALDLTSQAGSPPEPISLTFVYGTHTFAFSLANMDFAGSRRELEIDIPTEDYTSILNTDPTSVTLVVTYRGFRFDGTVTIFSFTNTLKGTLHDSILDIVEPSIDNLENRLEDELNELRGDLTGNDSTLAGIFPRISPYRTVESTIPEGGAYYLDDDGTTTIPSTLAEMNAVSAINPRWLGGETSLFVAVPINEGRVFNLKNITQGTEIRLDQATPNVTAIASFNENRITYFVYRVVSLTVGEVYEADRVTTTQVVAWQDDINNLKLGVDRIDAELSHGLLDIPEDVVDILDNDITVTEGAGSVTIATDYNRGLGNTNSQTVFEETNPNSPSGGSLNSRPWAENTGDRENRKLAYILDATTFTNQTYISAFDGTNTTALVTLTSPVFNARVNVPAIPAGTANQTVYPAPARVGSGPGIWQTIPTSELRNNRRVALDGELAFTRNIPTTATTLTIQYRGHANGNIVGAATTTLANVGGSTDVETTATITVGSESVTMTFRYVASIRQIQVITRAGGAAFQFVIEDVQVLLSYVESRTVPATPATVRDYPIATLAGRGRANVFAVKPSASGTAILVGDLHEVDTGYTFAELFGTTGYLTIASEQSVFFDYEDFNPISTVVYDLVNHSTLPQYGLFTTNHTNNSIVNLDTQFTARNDLGETVQLGILTAPNGNRYRIGVDNTGSLITTLIV